MTFIGPYQLVRPLGAGGMGEVHLARSPGSRLVALKVIRPEYADDHGFRWRFRREVDAARRVNGFFTPPVVDADTDGPQPWLATAYVPAPSLREVVERSGVLHEPGLRALGAGLAEALSAIHAAGQVHRDLKPSNVLVAGDGPRVIDIGISKALDATQVTRTDGTIGTPGYLAPELITSGAELGPAADVFSLGCVLVFAATGVNPFGTGSPADVCYRIVHEQPRLDGVPDTLGPLVLACLHKDPALRPQVAALLNALAPADPAALVSQGLRHELDRLGHEAASILRSPIVTPRKQPQTTPLKPSRRRFFGIAAAVGVGVAASVGAAIAWSESGQPATDEATAAPQAGAPKPEVPPGPSPSWTQTAPEAFSSGKLARLDGTVVWFDQKNASLSTQAPAHHCGLVTQNSPPK